MVLYIQSFISVCPCVTPAGKTHFPCLIPIFIYLTGKTTLSMTQFCCRYYRDRSARKMRKFLFNIIWNLEISYVMLFRIFMDNILAVDDRFVTGLNDTSSTLLIHGLLGLSVIKYCKAALLICVLSLCFEAEY